MIFVLCGGRVKKSDYSTPYYGVKLNCGNQGFDETGVGCVSCKKNLGLKHKYF